VKVLRSSFVIGGLLVALALGIFVSPFASSSPDGLERVSMDNAFDETADDHALADSPLADYGVEGIGNERLGTAASALIGVLMSFGFGLLLLGLAQRAGRRRAEDQPSEDVPVSA
jgi:hypothetical protein